VTRTGFYRKTNRDGTSRPGPYQHLAEEFTRRLGELRDAGATVDPRDAQVDRLKRQVDELKKRIITRDEQLAELSEFKVLAISRLAAQHDEIERLRTQVAKGSSLRAVPTAREGP
jgi:chromosome segregation ATPase